MFAPTGAPRQTARELLDGAFITVAVLHAECRASPRDSRLSVRNVLLDAFHISRYAVTQGRFAEFVRRTGYVTDAERVGWSFVFRNHLDDADPPAGGQMPATPWWVRIDAASWRNPFGTASVPEQQNDHPVVHVSWNDAQAYCAWGGFRLPTEAEWEFASRGGLEQKTYPRGDDLMPGGDHRCNIWQGVFPSNDLGDDGYTAPAPVNVFQPNSYGIYNTVGNTWEWCADFFSPDWHRTASPANPVGPDSGVGKVIRGGSYLCHESYCLRYRCSARTFNAPDASTGNLGFRVARD